MLQEQERFRVQVRVQEQGGHVRGKGRREGAVRGKGRSKGRGGPSEGAVREQEQGVVFEGRGGDDVGEGVGR